MDLINVYGFITHSNFYFILSFFLLSFVFSTSYLYTNFYPVIKYSTLVKVASIVCLLLLVLLADMPATSELSGNTIFSNMKLVLVIALCFHLMGDAIIELKDNLLYCMPFFMMGHLFYALIIYQDILTYQYLHNTTILLNFGMHQYVILLISLCFGGWVVFSLIKNLSGILQKGVVIYILALVVEALLALSHPASQSGISLILVGVYMYILSDCILAYNEFVSPIRLRTALVWPLYYFAQVFIIFSILNYQTILI